MTSAGPAQAATKRFNTRITLEISNTPPARAQRGTFYYFGDVKSRKRACRRRPVTLIRTGDTFPGFVAETPSAADGSYAFKEYINPATAGWYTQVPRKVLPSGKICRRAKSPLTYRK